MTGDHGSDPPSARWPLALRRRAALPRFGFGFGFGVGVAAVGALVAACFSACGTQDATAKGYARVELEELDEALIEVFCDRFDDCACAEGSRFASQATCREWASSLQQEVAQVADDLGLIYDPTCVGDILTDYVELDCDPGPSPHDVIDWQEIGISEDCVAPCAPIFGKRELGETCTRIDTLSSDCARGLHCNLGFCVDWCPPPREEGGRCDYESGCGHELYCSSSVGSGSCRAYVQAGERCEGGRCAEGLTCVLEDPSAPAAVMRCRPFAQLGEPCAGHAECASGSCPSGWCAQGPEEGKACSVTGACADGLECVDDRCKDRPEPGDPCEVRCEGPLACEDGVCREAPAMCSSDPPLLRDDDGEAP